MSNTKQTAEQLASKLNENIEQGWDNKLGSYVFIGKKGKQLIQQAITQAKAEERERCAEFIEDAAEDIENRGMAIAAHQLEEKAQLIRNLKDE